MSPTLSDKDSDDTNSNVSQEQSTDNNYSDVDLEITTEETDTKSSNSQTTSECDDCDSGKLSDESNVYRVPHNEPNIKESKSKSFRNVCCK